MTQALTKKGVEDVRGMLAENQHRFKTRLGAAIPFDYFLGCALTTIELNPKILECTKTSLLSALMTAAQLRLVPDGVLGQAYLVPYKGKVQLIPGYRGLITLARRSGEIKNIQARAVYEGDEFSFEFGLKESLHHIPAEKERGEFRAAYAVAEFKEGGVTFEVMWREDIESVRDRYSKSVDSDYSPWKTAFDEMAKKTVIRRLIKYLPLSTEMQEVVVKGEAMDAGIDLETGEIIDLDPKNGSKNGKKKTKPKGGVGAMKDALEEKNGNGADPEPGPEPENSIGQDLRTAIADKLMDEFPKKAENRRDKLRYYVGQVAGDPDMAQKINSVDDLADDLAEKVYEFIEGS